ncbi:MAG: dihydrolipoamide acetyltransferase family protein [Dehalococcoidia bacterium]
MRQQLSMPRLAESVTQGTVIRWLKANGDSVAVDEPVVEIETEKVNVEIPSPWSGVLEIAAAADETVVVGQPLAFVETAEPAALSPGAPTVVEAPASRPERRELSRSRHYTPAVQALGRQHNIDLSLVKGTGIGGRISRRDVEAYLQQTAAASLPSLDELVPLTPTRRTIAERMTLSAQTVPQAWLLMEADVTALVHARDAGREQFERDHSVDLSYLAIVARVVARSLKQHRYLNASWTEKGILLRGAINIGIPVATSEGLVVPVLRDAVSLSLADLSRAIAGLTERARSRRLRIEDIDGATFTLNNTGALGSIASAPLVNPPQAANLTLEAIVPRAVVRDDAIAIRHIVNLCLAFDHRILDGSAAAAFLTDVKRALEQESGPFI